MRNMKSLALALALVAALTTPAFAAPRDPGQLPGNHNGGNFISRLVTRIVHLFNDYPIEPHP
jgi:hypothetical protein